MRIPRGGWKCKKINRSQILESWVGLHMRFVHFNAFENEPRVNPTSEPKLRRDQANEAAAGENTAEGVEV